MIRMKIPLHIDPEEMLVDTMLHFWGFDEAVRKMESDAVKKAEQLARMRR